MLRKIAGACGVISQLVGVSMLLVAVSQSPWFSWTESYLSLLGVEGSARVLFNWGLILTGLLSLVFAIGLRRNLLLSRLGQVGVVSLILASIAMSAIGIFPSSADLSHDLASVLFFVFVILALLVIAVATLMVAKRGWGLLSLAAGVLILAFWLVPWPWRGGAIPQLLFCLPWSLWTIVFGVVLLVRRNPIDV